ncbi:hypothetical protein BABINDRAFT_10234 [Babjeviella inositovora NRRL Y-12698]|uniref:Uncharacterized protein n=1 Tax=Babjeviella inositovora NRRL Y-12698 TaxID=984486 RepID=A0A1E3QJS3_9ASCO|nr:uncharacterized protein BABINDRAFT_10234 [Babjeviella inositovora NRRL Y-12698]ODQ77332.1 hypothetical protein BABINDRAFT_10234 [Babjeviella inositovora NRRL Y-12698]
MNPYDKTNKPPVPLELQKRAKGLKLIMFGLPVFIISSYVLFERKVMGKERRVQTGEMMPDGTIREFEAWEIKEKDRNNRAPNTPGFLYGPQDKTCVKDFYDIKIDDN